MSLAPRSDARRGRAGRWLAILGIVFLVGCANALLPVLRFDSQAANWAAACVLFLMPLGAPVLVLRLPGRRLFRILGVVGLTPLIAFSLVLALITGACGHETRSRGIDPSFETLARLPLSASRVSAYLSNTGSVGSLLVVVRHEKSLLPGILVVRSLFVTGGEREVTLSAVDPLTVEVRVRGVPTIVHLRRFVYF